MENENYEPLYITNEKAYQLMIVDNNIHQIYPHKQEYVFILMC